MNEEVEFAAKQIHRDLVRDFRAAAAKAECLLVPFTTDSLDAVLGFSHQPIFTSQWLAEVEKKLESVAKHKAQRAFVELIVEKAKG